MIATQLADDGVLNRIEILKLVDENDVPASTHISRDRGDPEQLGGLQNQTVEIGDISLSDDVAIAVIELLVAVPERITAKAIARECVEDALVHLRRNLEPAKYGFLIRLIGDTEPKLQPDLLAELAQQL